MKQTKEECNCTVNEDVNCKDQDQNCDQNCENNNTSSDKMTEKEGSESSNESVLADQIKDWQNKYLRLSAEFDNYRKRTLKEKIELLESASEGVVKAILPIVDDFDRATAAMEKSDDVESLKNGMTLIHKRLREVLKQQGVVEIEAKDVDLDTDFHDAIAKFPVDDKDKKGKVIDVVEKGYMMKEKVIRFAKVVVGE